MTLIKDKDGMLLAIYVPRCDQDDHDGVKFFTTGDLSQQVASIRHKAGHRIAPHFHNAMSRSINQTQEVLIVRKGHVVALIYDGAKQLVCTFSLVEGDILILVDGGHGFEVMEDADIVEVKQGPYLGERDKTFIEQLDMGR